jgi:hypothetical protein
MYEKYQKFFNRASDIYGGVDGYNTLLEAVNSGQLQEDLSLTEHEIAKFVILDFFKERNTKGNNRTFGITGHINDLLLKCGAQEKILNSSLQ